jgi:pimeloyl-ACP methyl ester carboxylesterase
VRTRGLPNAHEGAIHAPKESLEFYREAGPRDAPTVLLLHGFPSSSHMFRALVVAEVALSLLLLVGATHGAL